MLTFHYYFSFIIIYDKSISYFSLHNISFQATLVWHLQSSVLSGIQYQGLDLPGSSSIFSISSFCALLVSTATKLGVFCFFSALYLFHYFEASTLLDIWCVLSYAFYLLTSLLIFLLKQRKFEFANYITPFSTFLTFQTIRRSFSFIMHLVLKYSLVIS
jgi:hypothetical protein